jgi:primosomal protein N' (replication factor Y)
VLIGTQMIAKGLDFPNVLLVGVICADSALFLPDWRAAERTFQLLAQVVGRTGRGPRGGRVVVQAFDPRHVAIRLGVSQDYEAFAAQELPLRREADYPPFSRLVRVVVHAADERDARARAELLATLLRAATPEGVSVMGPAPAPIPRIARQFRWHLVLKCLTDDAVAGALAALEGHSGPGGRARVLVDVDPVGML